MRSESMLDALRPIFIAAAFMAVLTGAARAESPYIKAMFSLPLTSDPAQMNDGPSLVLSNLIYDGLLSFTPDLELRPALAKSWRVEEGGRLLVFELRRDATFQDGTPITAAAVVSSLSRLLAPGSKVSSYYTCIAGAEAYRKGKSSTISGLRAKGNDVVEIELETPFPPFLSVLAGATAKVLPLAAGTDPMFFSNPVGSGPFRVVPATTTAHRDQIVLRAYDGYYAGAPKIQTLILKQMNGDEALKAAEKGEVSDLATYYLNGDEKAFQYGRHLYAPVAATWIIGLNVRLKPFDRIEARRALAAAIDAEDFRKRFYSSALPAKGYIPPGMPGFQWAYQSDTAHDERAASKPVHIREKIRIAIPMDIPKSKEIAVYLQARLKHAGFNAETVLMKWDDLMKGYTNKTLQAFLVSMNIDYPDTEFLVRNFESDNPDNFSGLKNPAIDALIRKARATPDRAARQQYYAELAKRLNAAAVTINLLYPQGHYWVNRCVNGFEPNLLADAYIDYRKVWITGQCTTLASTGL